MNFAYTYEKALLLAMAEPEELNARTNVGVKTIRGGLSFKLDLSDGRLPVPSLRKVFPKTAAAEIAWFLMGTRKSEFITKYAPIWDQFVEYDDITIPGPPSKKIQGPAIIRAAYGWRWRTAFARDQIGLALDALRKDPSNRRIYIAAWDPQIDGLGTPKQINVPCPVGFTLSIVAGELHSTMMLRSSDLFVGLPYDIMGHALLMDAFAGDLNVNLGVMQVTLAHAHLYVPHEPLVRKGLEMAADVLTPVVMMPAVGLGYIEERPDEYIKLVADSAATVKWPEYNPRPEVFK